MISGLQKFAGASQLSTASVPFWIVAVNFSTARGRPPNSADLTSDGSPGPKSLIADTRYRRVRASGQPLSLWTLSVLRVSETRSAHAPPSSEYSIR